jgi:hypothetical protein
MIREELRRLSTWGERHRRLLARVMIALALSLVVDAVGAGLVWYFEHGAKLATSTTSGTRSSSRRFSC